MTATAITIPSAVTAASLVEYARFPGEHHHSVAVGPLRPACRPPRPRSQHLRTLRHRPGLRPRDERPDLRRLLLSILDLPREGLLVRRPGRRQDIYLDEITYRSAAEWARGWHQRWSASANPQLLINRWTAVDPNIAVPSPVMHYTSHPLVPSAPRGYCGERWVSVRRPRRSARRLCQGQCW